MDIRAFDVPAADRAAFVKFMALVARAPNVLARILDAMGLPSAAPEVRPARGPPEPNLVEVVRNL